MIKIKTLFIATAVAALSLAMPVQAQDAGKEHLEKYFQAIGADLSARRDSAMSVMIQLDDEQKKAFWPIKKQYDEALRAIFMERFQLISDFDAVHDKLNASNSAKIAERAFALEDKRTALHRQYFKLMSEQVSPVVAVQYIQLQSQFETMADTKVGAIAPLAMN